MARIAFGYSSPEALISLAMLTIAMLTIAMLTIGGHPPVRLGRK